MNYIKNKDEFNGITKKLYLENIEDLKIYTKEILSFFNAKENNFVLEFSKNLFVKVDIN